MRNEIHLSDKGNREERFTGRSRGMRKIDDDERRTTNDDDDDDTTRKVWTLNRRALDAG